MGRRKRKGGAQSRPSILKKKKKKSIFDWMQPSPPVSLEPPKKISFALETSDEQSKDIWDVLEEQANTLDTTLKEYKEAYTDFMITHKKYIDAATKHENTEHYFKDDWEKSVRKNQLEEKIRELGRVINRYMRTPEQKSREVVDNKSFKKNKEKREHAQNILLTKNEFANYQDIRNRFKIITNEYEFGALWGEGSFYDDVIEQSIMNMKEQATKEAKEHAEEEEGEEVE